MATRLVKGRHLLRNLNVFACKHQFDSCMAAAIRLQSTTVQQLVYSEYGDPLQVVQAVTHELSAPKSKEVTVRMLAAPVNPADINTIQGVYPVKPVLPAVGGNEGVGEVMATGEGVTTLRVGDRVVPKQPGWGTWRSHAVALESAFIKVSKELTSAEAATLTVNPCTAYRMLKDFVQLQPGDTVIQNGANGACGLYVIQLCKAWGLKSINIVRNRPDIDVLRYSLVSLGATHVITEEELRSTEMFKKQGVPKPRLALNAVGGKNATEMIRHMDHGGYVVTYGGMSRQPVTIPTSAFIFKDIRSVGYWMTRWSKENDNSPERIKMLDEVTSLIIDGKIKVPPHTLVPFAQFKEVLQNTSNPKGFAGTKYILSFQ